MEQSHIGQQTALRQGVGCFALQTSRMAGWLRVCASHGGVWRSRSMTSLILNLGCSWRWEVHFPVELEFGVTSQTVWTPWRGNKYFVPVGNLVGGGGPPLFRPWPGQSPDPQFYCSSHLPNEFEHNPAAIMGLHKWFLTVRISSQNLFPWNQVIMKSILLIVYDVIIVNALIRLQIGLPFTLLTFHFLFDMVASPSGLLV